MENKTIDTNYSLLIDPNQLLYLTPMLREKQKSLKDQHFSNYYSHIFQTINKSHNLTSFSLTEKTLNNINNHKKISDNYKNDIMINKRNFKDPRKINYKLLKYNPNI